MMRFTFVSAHDTDAKKNNSMLNRVRVKGPNKSIRTTTTKATTEKGELSPSRILLKHALFVHLDEHLLAACLQSSEHDNYSDSANNLHA